MADTKGTIVSAALRLFAEKGLRAVTIREICKAAKVNVALINYHFRDKEGLYRACIEEALRLAACRELPGLADTVRDARSWKAAIRRWVAGFSRALHSASGGEALVAGFFRQEVVNPSQMSDLIRTRYVEPAYECLSRLFGMAVRDDDERRCWVESVWSQLSAYALVAPTWHTLFRPAAADTEAWGESFADFVCRRIFSELKYRPRLAARV